MFTSNITYIWLEWEFVYLAGILDAFSRRLHGWALGRTLEATLTLEVLRMALEQRQPAAGPKHLMIPGTCCRPDPARQKS